MKNKTLKKITIVGLFSLLAILFYYLGLGQYFTLEYLQESQNNLRSLYHESPVLVISVYMAIYILVTALSLPGAVVMTLAGGGLFGLLAGTIIVSFASTIGATLACAVSRFLLREWVQNRFGEKLSAINEGIQKEGAFYLFTLRLIPIFPFFVINLVLGLSKLPLLTFFWVSQVGMLAGTIVYVNAGKEIAKIDSLSGILSPGLIVSFIILGLFPITVKKLLAIFKNR